jgi:CRISPR-associated endonuclease/helicase Cas3
VYYAHTLPGRPDSDWEPLLRHLSEVARAARDNGQRFGLGELAEIAGRVHDLGKYTPGFQARLNGGAKVDHSTAGAVWAHQHLPPRWGRLLAHVVAGHHAGLQDGLFDPEGRMESKRGSLAAVQRAAQADGLPLPTRVDAPPRLTALRGQEGFHIAFLTRMVFSCLIDADRTATACFVHGAPADPPQPSIQALEAAFQASTARREPRPGPVNDLRNDVLRTVLAKAAGPKGVFTLTVPTGGGKTLTSLAFALAHARENELDRVIVVIPFTSIIEQTAQVYRDALGPLGHAVLEHHSGFDMEHEAKWSDERVGPERLRLAMERWDSPIVVTTAVQFFESLFAARPSRCRKLHSIARSVIVVDEAQTMPLDLLRPCVAALKELQRNYACSVVLCTATQPALTAEPGGAGFPGGFRAPVELAPPGPALFQALRRVTVRDIGVQDDDALVARMASSGQALCIVNQRAHARALFKAMAKLDGARHLSTCMHSVHRRRVLDEIRDDLRNGRPCRVISTSLVEAGVDVDFPLVLRATAGLDQIAQAAGRCNREGRNAAEDSEVLVFEAPEFGVIRQLRVQAETGRIMLRKYAFGDPFGPEAMRDYFESLYHRKGKEELDRKGVLEMCADHAGDMNFPFESIATAMRFIDDTMVPVIVPKEEAQPGEVIALVEGLRYGGIGGVARALNRYTVGVPRRVRSAMVLQGVAEVIRQAELGDQFVVLLNLDLYTPEAGLDWEDLTFLAAENLIA